MTFKELQEELISRDYVSLGAQGLMHMYQKRDNEDDTLLVEEHSEGGDDGFDAYKLMSAEEVKKMLARHYYRPDLRPASFATIPPGWEYVESPWDIVTRAKLPRSPFRHGVIAYAIQLTAEQEEQYSLTYLGDVYGKWLSRKPEAGDAK